eukprot:gnl/MRDRNA2_/MRDRNA2_71921_c0_seq1.p1 gnl/MRDRNA2_/MRDRNA2_71921_c0~~gnl/MRDRNA2_/MRDRNA2_71921_c0_seq1.p1  ORF type:complete len:1031 (-),score=175.29 gnl/MRDRNA2_/MRDRNA2_71921_c0_seq1:93-2975(-)
MAHYLRSGLYDWVAWLDCDSILMNMNRTLDSIVYKYAGLRLDSSVSHAEPGSESHTDVPVTLGARHAKVPHPHEELEAYATHVGSCNTAAGCIVSVEVRVNPEVRYTLQVSTALIDMADEDERIGEVSVDDHDMGGCNPSPDSDHDCGFAECIEKPIPEALTADGLVVLRVHSIRTHDDCHCDPLTHECYSLFFPPEQVLESDGAVVDPKFGMYVHFKLVPREMPPLPSDAKRSTSAEEGLSRSLSELEGHIGNDATDKRSSKILDRLTELQTKEEIEDELTKVGCSCAPTCPAQHGLFWSGQQPFPGVAGAELRRFGAECDGPDMIFSFNASVEDCTNLCRVTEGCTFVAYGTGLKAGRCLWEMNDCLRFEQDHYLVFDIGDPESATSESSLNSLHLDCTSVCARAHCSHNDKAIQHKGNTSNQVGKGSAAVGSFNKAPVRDGVEDEALLLMNRSSADFSRVNMTSAVASTAACTCGDVCPKQPPWARQEPQALQLPVANIRRLNSECQGSDVLFDFNASLPECAELCRAVEGCHFFALGTGKKKGRCMWERSDCIAFETDSYHVYDIGALIDEHHSFEPREVSENQIRCTSVCDHAHCQQYDGFQMGLRRHVKSSSGGTLESVAPATPAPTPPSLHEQSLTASPQIAENAVTIGCSCAMYCPRMPYWSQAYWPGQHRATLRRLNSECEGPDVVLSLNAALPRCAALCRATEGCRFFSHGKGPKRGRCLWEFGDCLSFETDSYDVYDAYDGYADSDVNHWVTGPASQDGCSAACDRAFCVEESAPGVYGAPLDVDDGAVDLLITEEGWGLSSANWMIRRSTWSINFLESAFLVAHQDMPLFGDQDAMIYLLTNNRALDPTLAGDSLDPHAKVIAQRELNAYDALNAFHMRCDAFQDGDLLVTFPGCKDPTSCNPLFHEAISYSQGHRPGSQPTWSQIRLYGPPRLAAQIYQQAEQMGEA